VLKVNIPRNDSEVHPPARRPPSASGAGLLTKGDGGHEVMMGDLVLTEDEVNPVMSAILNNGLDVTALHNHFFWEQPRIFFMHVHGRGSAAELTRRVKPAVDPSIRLPGRRLRPPRPRRLPPAASVLDTAALARIIGHAGEQNGPVHKITIGRPDIDLRSTARINARMGLNTGRPSRARTPMPWSRATAMREAEVARCSKRPRARPTSWRFTTT
jgi:hypothetical protein